MSKLIGIYKITSPTGRIYIGQSIDIETRWKAYRGMGSKIKSQPKIYNSLLKYSPKNHIFEIIEECKVEELNIKEDYWQHFFKVFDEQGLNCMKVSLEGQVGSHSEETIEKIKATKRNKPRPVEKTANHGRIVSEEQKIKMRETIKNNGGRCGTNNPMFGKVGFANPNFGKKYIMSEKAIANLPRGENHRCSVLVLDTQTGVFFSCIKEASEAYNIEYQHLVWILRGKWENNTNLIRC